MGQRLVKKPYPAAPLRHFVTPLPGAGRGKCSVSRQKRLRISSYLQGSSTLAVRSPSVTVTRRIPVFPACTTVWASPK